MYVCMMCVQSELNKFGTLDIYTHTRTRAHPVAGCILYRHYYIIDLVMIIIIRRRL